MRTDDASADKKFGQIAQPSEMLCVKILAGTAVEIEAAGDTSARNVDGRDQIKFRLVGPLKADDVDVIASGAPATLTASEKVNSQFPHPSAAVSGAGEVIAVDGTPVPLCILDEMAGDEESEERDRRMMIVTCAVFPSPSLALLYGLRRRASQQTPSRKRYHALIPVDVTVLALKFYDGVIPWD